METDFSGAAIRGAAQRSKAIRDMVDKGVETRWPSKDMVVAVESKQENEMMKCVALLLEIIGNGEEANSILNEALDIVQQACRADREPEARDITSTEFFPVLIRGPNEEDWPVFEPPAAYTERGASKLLAAYREDNSKGLSPEQVKEGFVRRSHNPKDAGFKVNINGVELLKWVSEDPGPVAGKGSKLPAPATEESLPGVIPTEKWFGPGLARWNESFRKLPFTLTSTYLVWLVLIKEKKLNLLAAKKHGIVHLATGLLFQCIEWVSRKGGSLLSKRATTDVRHLFEAWLKNEPPNKPFWIHEWSSPMKYEYVTASSLGMETKVKMKLAAWSKDEMVKGTPGLDPKKKNKSKEEIVSTIDDKNVLDLRIPFVEPDDGPPRMTMNATSTACFMRMYLGYSTAVEATGSNHLEGFGAYYLEVYRYLAEKPGQRGKKLAKIVGRVPQMIMAHERKVWAPTTVLLNSSKELLCVQRIHADPLSVACMAESLDTQPFLSAIGEKVFDAHERLGPALRVIYDAWKDKTLAPWSSEVLDVLTHLQSPGSVEGYSRSCLGTLAATGYTLYEMRLTRDGIDSKAPVGNEPLPAISAVEQDLWTRVLDRIQVPTVEEMQRSLIELSAAKSAGNDSVRIKTTRATALGEAQGSKETQNKEQNLSNNKKDGVLTLAGDRVMARGVLDGIAQVDRPLRSNVRVTTARIMRLIYNVPLGQQALLRPLYEALKLMMGHEPRYSLRNAKGAPVEVKAAHINNSIHLMLQYPNVRMGAVADDASKFDQYKGQRHHDSLIRLLLGKAKALGDDGNRGFSAKYGENYYALLAKMYKSWDRNYFTHEVDKENNITVIMVLDTDPSGALTTAEDNTLAAEAALLLMLLATNDDSLRTSFYMWGDDSYTMLKANTPEEFIQKIRTRERVGKDCGLVYDTIDGAQNGLLVHYLQIIYWCGQSFQRRIPIDHENESRASIIGLGSIVDKMISLSQRGGNLDLCDMLVLSTVIQGSRMKVFGKQAKLPYDTFAAPGGLLNRQLMGFSSPNSRLWLNLNWPWLAAEGTEGMVAKRPQVDKAATVGRRLLADGDQMVKYHVGTEGDIVPLRARLESVSKAFIERDRATDSVAALFRLQRTHGTDVNKNVSHYSEWVERSAEKAMGEAAVERVFNKDFKEQALINAGYIPKRRDDPKPTLEMDPVEKYTGVRIGGYNLSFRMSRDYILKCSRISPRSYGVFPYQFEVHSSHLTQPWVTTFKWHPYWSRSRHLNLLLSFCGVQTGRSVISQQDLKQKFSPSHFRPDMTADEVINAVRGAPDGGAQDVLSVIGFSREEIVTLLPHVREIGIYNDLAQVNEYTGLDEILQSIDVSVIRELIQFTAPETINIIDPHVQRVMFTQYISLLVDEFNMVSYLMTAWEDLEVRIPVPKII
jgi:hypothetical protein